MRYLIIGGKSVFGEGLAVRLLAKPDTELVFATKLPSEEHNICKYEKLYWHNLDVRSEADVNRIVSSAKADVIFDLATQDSVGYAWKNPIETVDINVSGTVNVLNAVRDFSPNTRLIHQTPLNVGKHNAVVAEGGGVVGKVENLARNIINSENARHSRFGTELFASDVTI